MKFNSDNSNNTKKKFDKSTNFWKKEISILGNRFSDKKKEAFYEELSVLLHSGIDLKRSLEILKESTNKEIESKFYDDTIYSITEGRNFAAALNKTKKFSIYEIKSIEIGENTGTTSKILKELSGYYENRNKQKREIITAISYPIIVLATAVIVIFFMLNYVVPMFKDIFNQNNLELPFLTRLIISFSDLMRIHFLKILFFLIALFLTAYFIRNKFWFKIVKDKMILNIPFFGGYVRKIKLTRLMQNLSLQTNAKIPLSSALNSVSELINFYPLTQNLKQIEEDIIKGKSISESFGKHKIFDLKIIAFLKVAEETNKTDYVFQNLYEQYALESDHYAKNIANYLNPLLTLLVGFIVAVILIGMYLPMFKLSSVIG